MQAQKQLPVGIDFGTSTSLISVFRDGEPYPVPDSSNRFKSPIVPSLVALDSRDRLIVGEQARANVDLPGRGVREVKRTMDSPQPVKLGDREYRPEVIASMVIKKLKENAEARFGPITEVVLSVPAIFSEVGKYNTKQAAKLAGLNAIHLISEPTAAALAYGIRNLDADEKVLVFDFGGGTLDISVIEMMDGVLDVNGTFGDPHLGGKDFDEVLINLAVSKFKAQEGPDVEVSARDLSKLKEEAEACKIALSEQEGFTIMIPFFGSRDGIPLDLEVDISRDEFVAAYSHLLARARQCLESALTASKATPESIQRVLMVGGTTYIPAVREMVASVFNCPISTDVPPDLAVSMGAAIMAHLKQQTEADGEAPLQLIDSYAYGIGVEVADIVHGQIQLTYDPLSAPNTTIPYSVSKNYNLLWPDQESIEVRVFQTLNPHTNSLAEAYFTGISAVIEDIPPSPTGIPHPIRIDFSINTDQMIELRAQLPTTGQSLIVRANTNELRLEDPEEFKKLKDQVDDLW